MHKRSSVSVTRSDTAADVTLVAVPLSSPAAASFIHGHTARERRWLHFSNIKIEAAIFMLIALTFAAVLGQSAITNKSLILSSHIGQFEPYTYTDVWNGGTSTVNAQPKQPLTWSCTLKPTIQYPFCGYALKLADVNAGKAVDFSHYQDITLHLTYHGVGDHMRLILKNEIPAALRRRVKDDTMPLTTEFQIVNGDNEIHLKLDELATEQWWVGKNALTTDEARAKPDHIVSVELVSGSLTPAGHFDVAVQSLTFKGAYISSELWYLIILGVWLVLTGAFLVYRFLNLRRGYEARQRHLAEESQVLARARAAAEEASAAKSQFLANMSHELRTPLNAILGYAQFLRTDELSEQQRTAVRTIHQSGEHLLTMITDILDIAKVEAGRLDILPAPFDIRACVDSVAQMTRLRAEEKNLRFTVTIADDVPSGVIGDQKRVRQVLINLLGNAIKFTAAGEVRMDVTCVGTSEGETRLRFEVSDTGVGIAQDQLSRIFRPFEQAGNAIDRSGGTGLGLSITQQIVHMMQGEVGVSSVPGAGSRFQVELPFALSALADDDDRPVQQLTDATATADSTAQMTAPHGDVLAQLLSLARAGNLRAIRKEIPRIHALGPQYQSFAERLDALAAAYQSPAVLRLIEQYAQQGDAA